VVKVRIGVAAGPGVADDPKQFLGLVDALDDLGYDSIWIPDVITSGVLDPVAALSVAAGRRQRLKVGTHLIVPGRDPVRLAKELATLDQLSEGRLLLLAVLGLRQPAELDAQAVEASARSRMLEESLHIMRTLWSGDELHFEGEFHRYSGTTLAVRPHQDPLEVWLGGMVPASLRRCGKIGEGWMPGMVTPTEAHEARLAIDAAAAAAGRAIDGEHFGMNVQWVDEMTDEVRAAVATRRPEGKAEDFVGVGAEGLADKLEGFLEVGFSKFVVRPLLQPSSWPSAVESVSKVLELQN
jgi:probable F420-dependent oxidoreductase